MAAKGCRELAAMGIDLIEQPVSAQDNAALVRLSHHIETAILADEAVATHYDGYRLAQQGFSRAFALEKLPKRAARPAFYAGTSRRRRVSDCMAAPCWKEPWAPSHRCAPGRRCRCNGALKCLVRCCSKDDIVSVPLNVHRRRRRPARRRRVWVSELDEDKLRFYARKAWDMTGENICCLKWI